MNVQLEDETFKIKPNFLEFFSSETIHYHVSNWQDYPILKNFDKFKISIS